MQRLTQRAGWLPAARYTNLRDTKTFNKLGFLDIDWRNYDFSRHLESTVATRPLITVARDIEDRKQLSPVLDQAYRLMEHARHVVIVPKDPRLASHLEDLIPGEFLLGYSVPSAYGGTKLPLTSFKRPVHLLGGRPDVQRAIAQTLDVFSFDCNRFTLDAKFGDFFNGQRFIPHPVGGYETCLQESINHINKIWQGYRRPRKT